MYIYICIERERERICYIIYIYIYIHTYISEDIARLAVASEEQVVMEVFEVMPEEVQDSICQLSKQLFSMVNTALWVRQAAESGDTEDLCEALCDSAANPVTLEIMRRAAIAGGLILLLLLLLLLYDYHHYN